MERHGYPLAAQHGREHRRLAEDLDRIRRDFDVSGLSQTLLALRRWLFRHVRHSDRQLAEFLNSRDLPRP